MQSRKINDTLLLNKSMKHSERFGTNVVFKQPEVGFVNLKTWE